MEERVLVSRSESETLEAGRALARELRRRLPEPSFVRLSGELGAGKTVFARGFVLEWLARSGEPSPPENVTSPSFNIARVYGAKPPVAHLDLYRVKSIEELRELGFEHYFFEQGCCLVEWLEQVPEALALLPADALDVSIAFRANPTERSIRVREMKAPS